MPFRKIEPRDATDGSSSQTPGQAPQLDVYRAGLVGKNQEGTPVSGGRIHTFDCKRADSQATFDKVATQNMIDEANRTYANNLGKVQHLNEKGADGKTPAQRGTDTSAANRFFKNYQGLIDPTGNQGQ